MTDTKFRLVVEFELLPGCKGLLRELAAEHNDIRDRKLPVAEVARQMLTAEMVSNAEFEHIPITITSSTIEEVT